jgi:hypothetical protein
MVKASEYSPIAEVHSSKTYVGSRGPWVTSYQVLQKAEVLGFECSPMEWLGTLIIFFTCFNLSEMLLHLKQMC